MKYLSYLLFLLFSTLCYAEDKEKWPKEIEKIEKEFSGLIAELDEGLKKDIRKLEEAHQKNVVKEKKKRIEKYEAELKKVLSKGDPSQLSLAGELQKRIAGLKESSKNEPSFKKTIGSIKGKLSYELYYGKWREIPKFDDLKSAKKGFCNNFKFDFAKKKDLFAVRYKGKIKIEKSGHYVFALNSDDGSKLYINGKLIINHDGLHSANTKKGKAKLSSGYQTIEIHFLEGKGDEVLKFGMGFDSAEIKPVDFSLFTTK